MNESYLEGSRKRIVMYLVTGGSGYLGSHLAGELIARGNKVRVFDVFKSPYVPAKARFLKGDMTNPKHVAKAMKNVDVVFHLAFIQSLSRRPLRDKYLINIGGTKNILKAALAQKVKRLVLASTIEIYGTCPPFGCTEDAPTDNPVGWYGRHKLECEKLCRRHMKKGLKATMLRMPAICGPRHYNHGPTLDLMDRIIENRPVPLPGNGDIPGNMTHYEDVVGAFILAAEKNEAVGEAFNICAEQPATHREIIQAMKDAAGSRSPLIPVPEALARVGLGLAVFFGLSDIPDHQVGYAFHPNHYSAEKAKRLLGHIPRYTVQDAARQQIIGYMENREYVRQRNKSY